MSMTGGRLLQTGLVKQHSLNYAKYNLERKRTVKLTDENIMTL